MREMLHSHFCKLGIMIPLYFCKLGARRSTLALFAIYPRGKIRKVCLSGRYPWTLKIVRAAHVFLSRFASAVCLMAIKNTRQPDYRPQCVSLFLYPRSDSETRKFCKMLRCKFAIILPHIFYLFAICLRLYYLKPEYRNGTLKICHTFQNGEYEIPTVFILCLW